MKHKWFSAVFIFAVLSGCSRPPDLEAPCYNFGKSCPQYPINQEPIGDKA